MSGSYIGLAAAAATEFSVRALPLGSRGAVWLTAGVAVLVVSVIGSVLIRRNRPADSPRPEPAMTA
jgi:hypothetical protein